MAPKFQIIVFGARRKIFRYVDFSKNFLEEISFRQRPATIFVGQLPDLLNQAVRRATLSLK